MNLHINHQNIIIITSSFTTSIINDQDHLQNNLFNSFLFITIFPSKIVENRIDEVL